MRTFDPKLMLFYGCVLTVGHSLLTATGGPRVNFYHLSCVGPTALGQIDGGFLPPRAEVGTIYRSTIPGWTIVSMVDYSIDRRPGSNANFLYPVADLSVEEMIATAKLAFPEITARLRL